MQRPMLLPMMLAMLLPMAAGATECRSSTPAQVARAAAGHTQSVVSIVIRTADGRPAYGAGILWDGGGHVVTNDHVAAAGDGYLVEFSDGASRSARLVARAPGRDLAVLKVYGATPEPAPRTRSHDLRAGDPVIAVGNPFGRGLSMAGGVISAFDREIITGPATRLSGMLQTTVALSPGSSGGPLFDCGGAVVGINTAVSRSPSSGQAMGFAIPIERVAEAVAAMLENPSLADVTPTQPAAPVAAVSRPGLGLYVAANAGGVLMVQSVAPDSPAAQAGAQAGDAITHANGRPVHSPSDLLALVHETGVGSTAVLRVVRGGKPVQVRVPVASWTVVEQTLY